MKVISFFLFLVLLCTTFSLSSGAAARPKSDKEISCLDNIDIDIEEGTLILRSKLDADEVVEITNDYELFINGKHVKTDRRQRKLLKKYYNQFMEIFEYAMEIGHEGAKIGIKGAKVGLNAAARVIQAIFTEDDLDDLEQEIEEEAEKLEEEADELEEMAEEIEEMAEEFEELHYELQEEIPELKRLEWF